MPAYNHGSILLADDDTDDCAFFEEALGDIVLNTRFTTVHDGEQLMQHLLKDAGVLPDIIFLDLNMPRKNGFECLLEIKQHQILKLLPVIILSTSYEQEVVNLLYQSGAHYFIRKPSLFSKFKKIIHSTLATMAIEKYMRPNKENFVLTSD